MQSTRLSRLLLALGTAAIGLTLAACGGGGGSMSVTSPGLAKMIGPEGGVVDGPDGTSLLVPAGSLAAPTALRIVASAVPAGDIADATGAATRYTIEPAGTPFAVAATLSIPADRSALAADEQFGVFTAGTGGGLDEAQTVLDKTAGKLLTKLRTATVVIGTRRMLDRSLASGWCHSTWVKADGTLWGAGCVHNLGASIPDLDSATPMQAVTASGPLTKVKSVAAGGYTTLALRKDGTVWGAGDTLAAAPGTQRREMTQVFTDAKSIAVGNYHELILKADGTLWGAGANDLGQLGDGSYSNNDSYHQVLSNVRQMSAGGYHSLAVTPSGELFATGNNQHGELGIAGLAAGSINTWQAVMKGVAVAAAGDAYSIVLLKDGRLLMAGSSNSSSRLGDAESYPGTGARRAWTEVMVHPFNPIVALVSGDANSGVIDRNGTFYSTGTGWGGSGDSGWVQWFSNAVNAEFSLGFGHVLLDDGTLYAAGQDNSRGQFGDGTTSNSFFWKQVGSGVKVPLR